MGRAVGSFQALPDPPKSGNHLWPRCLVPTDAFHRKHFLALNLRKHLVCRKGPRSAWQLQRICLWAWGTFATLSFREWTSLLKEPGRKWNLRPKGLIWGIRDIIPIVPLRVGLREV